MVNRATKLRDASATDSKKGKEIGESKESINKAWARVGGEVGAGKELSNKDYNRALKKLDDELVKLQQWVVAKGLKVCLVFEGRDTAGKSSTINTMLARVSPRVFRHTALPAPTEREKTQMYAQRYIPHLPAAGEIAVFDRSWYNRAGVERVMGFCTEDEAKEFLDVVPQFEKLMVKSGIILIKYWMEVSADEQTRRLKSRISDGRKMWKLSPMDVKSYSRYDDYTKARDEMFAASDTSWAPWYFVVSEDKKRARLNVITHILKQIPYKAIKTATTKLPHRKTGRYKSPDYPVKYVPAVY